MTSYGVDSIKPRVQNTSEFWIASTFLVLNLVKLAGVALYCQIVLLFENVSKWLKKEMGKNEK